MRSQSKNIRRQWEGSTISWTGKSWLVTHEIDCPRLIIAVDELVTQVSRSAGDLFSIEMRKKGGTRVKNTPLGAILLKAVGMNLALVHCHLPRHRFSPYFELWEKSMGYFPVLVLPLVESDVAPVNEWVSQLRERAKSDSYANLVRDQERASRKRARSLRSYLNALFETYAKLLFVRVDVGYRHECPEISAPNQVTDEEATEHLAKLIKFIQAKIFAQVGYVWKREHGAFKGPHNHVMVILNGHQAREGITWGKVVGEKWNEIVGERGVYWNCNANIEEYLRRGRLGIGLIHYADEALRAGLDYAAMYLAKADYYARFHSPIIKRTFGKGLARSKKERRGRRRQR